jgi:hypothetical protein
MISHIQLTLHFMDKQGHSIHDGLAHMEQPDSRKKHVTLRSEGEIDRSKTRRGSQRGERSKSGRPQQQSFRGSVRTTLRRGYAAESKRVHGLLRTDPLAWGVKELQEAGRSHPLPLPLLVNLVLATGSPTWTYR